MYSHWSVLNILCCSLIPSLHLFVIQHHVVWTFCSLTHLFDVWPLFTALIGTCKSLRAIVAKPRWGQSRTGVIEMRNSIITSVHVENNLQKNSLTSSKHRKTKSNINTSSSYYVFLFIDRACHFRLQWEIISFFFLFICI